MFRKLTSKKPYVVSGREAVPLFLIQKGEVESITPFTRKEKYINQIVGGGDTAPKTPQTREELFFADILGEVVAPSPITRAEKYLAKIANKYSGELPEPVTRIERFLARAAGMDVTIPTPITREEMFWADYALIVEKEISGIPPLRFNAIAGALKNYRIYGNTVNGESVGDLVESGEHSGEYVVPVKIEGKNLIQNIAISRTTTTGLTITVNSDKSVIVDGTTNDGKASGIALGGNTVLGKGTFILSGCPEGGSGETYRLICVINDGGTQKNAVDFGNGSSITLTSDDATIINNGFYLAVKSCDNKTFYPMLRRAEIADGTYEPYHIPTTTNIYLPEQIKKVGDEAEYIDFKEQKQYFADGTSTAVTLPALDLFAGTNVLTVETEVQPSKVYVKGKIEEVEST